MTLRLLIRIPLICLVRIEKQLHGKLKPAANEANCQAWPPFPSPLSLHATGTDTPPSWTKVGHNRIELQMQNDVNWF